MGVDTGQKVKYSCLLKCKIINKKREEQIMSSGSSRWKYINAMRATSQASRRRGSTPQYLSGQAAKDAGLPFG